MNRKYILSFLVFLTSGFLAVGDLHGQEIRIDAAKVEGRVSRYLTGACIEDVNHEIYGGIYSQMIFGESFQEPAPPPVIAGFKNLGGRWLVKDGVVHIQAQDGPKLISNQAAFKDGDAGVEVKFADRKEGNAGLIVRAREAGVGADKFIGYEVSLEPGRQRLVLGRHRNNWEPIKEAPCEVPVDRWISLEVKLAGTVLEIIVDGKSLMRYDDGKQALSAGQVGLRAWRREASYRNLWVKVGKGANPLAFKQTEQPEVSGMWRAIHRGAAQGSYALISQHPFIGSQSQQMTLYFRRRRMGRRKSEPQSLGHELCRRPTL